MKATAQNKARLQTEIEQLMTQLKELGAVKIILFGSLARDQVSLFSDIDLLVLFDQHRPARELTRWVYQHLQTTEAVDILAYSVKAFRQRQRRPFFQKILQEGKVLYEKLE